jgi:hypothetical protein
MAWRKDVWIKARAARSSFASMPSSNSGSIRRTTSSSRERTRESPLSPSPRSRNSAPSAANASTDKFRVCHLVINDWKLILQSAILEDPLIIVNDTKDPVPQELLGLSFHLRAASGPLGSAPIRTKKLNQESQKSAKQASVPSQIWALRSRLEKQPTDLRRCHH